MRLSHCPGLHIVERKLLSPNPSPSHLQPCLWRMDSQGTSWDTRKQASWYCRHPGIRQKCKAASPKMNASHVLATNGHITYPPLSSCCSSVREHEERKHAVGTRRALGSSELTKQSQAVSIKWESFFSFLKAT